MFVSSMVGAYLVFRACKRYSSSFIEKYTKKNRILEAVAIVIAHDSFKVSLLLRLSPLAFGLGNAALGSMNIKLKPYMWTTFIGLFKNLFPVYFGFSMKKLTSLEDNESLGTFSLILLITGAVFFVFVSVYIYFQLRIVLKRLDIEKIDNLSENIETLLNQTNILEECEESDIEMQVFTEKYIE